ncbi:cell division protein SepF [Aminipila butyrica]|uniref:Cell division protein SepF n=1 Tax=Aminipila butyrica TaxID=433296 RepID=A0A858BWA5_9FIRM|nr:cell division protein SepF [Aminipila butyrica]QIB69014.1 cell division protein SepF [Aminipila butyrica]
MGIFGMFKDLVGIEDVEDDGPDEEVMTPEPERKAIETRNSFTAPRPEVREPKVVTMTGKPLTANTAPFKMVVIEPKGFDECPKLVDNLKAKKPIIINLEKIETETARKIFDFLSGATYAVNGNVQKIANNIFVFAPENVDILANVEHKGIDLGASPKSPWR